MIARSADAVTAVVAVEVLSAGSGSLIGLATLAVSDRLPACAGAVTVTVIVGAVAPVASAGLVQVTETLPALPQTQPVPVAETNVTPAGSASVTVRLTASDGPLFTTTSEYATLPPATTVAGPVFVMARSAEAVTVVLTEAVLLVRSGSAAVEDTDAVLDTVAAWPGAVTVTVMGAAEVPAARVASVQLTETFPTLVQTQPVPVADTKVTPAGSVSVTRRWRRRTDRCRSPSGRSRWSRQRRRSPGRSW